MAGYTRQDTGDNIATGKVINASDFDNEYNALESAFNNSSGHKHDGTAAEGARITVIGPSGQYSTDANAIFPTTQQVGGLGKSSFEFANLFVDNLKMDGNVISSTNTDGDITITPNGNGFVIVAEGDLKIGSTAVTATGAELNLMDGGTSVGTTAVAGGDGIVTNDGGTMQQTSVDTFDTYLSQTTKTLTNKTLTTPVVNAGLQLKNGATSAGFIEFFEDSDNGTNKVTLIGPASTADVTLTLPSATDTLVGQATTDTLTNKTLTSPVLGGTTSSASGNIVLDPYTYKLEVKGGSTGGSTSGMIQLNCENNSHGQTIQSQPHSAGVTNKMLLPAGADSTLVSLVSTDTLSNKTLTAPKFADAGFIADANGNEMIVFQTTTSAENALEITNGASGGAVVIGAFSGGGEDANIDITITPKGTGEVNIAQDDLNYGGTAITATGAEINLIDGGTARGSDALADGDGILINDGGTMKMTNVQTVRTYMETNTATTGKAIAMAIVFG
jgi:hypothetical protein